MSTAARDLPVATDTRERLPDPSLWHLLGPKVLTARARAASKEPGAGLRFLFLAFFGFAFWAFIYGMLFRLLKYFRGVQEIGPLLAGKLLGLILVASKEP